VSRGTPHGTDGSSLPELLVAAGVVLVALGMVGSALVAPLTLMVRAGDADVRQMEMDRAADAVARTLASARPGNGAPALAHVGRDRLELRIGDLRDAQHIVVELRDGMLTIDHPDGRVDTIPEGMVIGGIDTELSAFAALTVDGRDIAAPLVTGQSDGSAAALLSEVVAIELHLIDASEDGQDRPRATRTVHLQLRLPLAADPAA